MEAFAKSITLDDKQARYYDLSEYHTTVATSHDKRPTAHFYGGNGFTTGSYSPLLTELAQNFELSSLAMRGYWYDKPKKKILTREEDSNLLIAFLEQTQDAPIIGIGHSQGATATAMAAAKRPDLFSELYLIEPVTFTKQQAMLYKLMPRAILKTQEPFKSTLSKQAIWPSVAAYYDHLRQKNAYRRISDEHLQVFVEQSLVGHANDRFELLFAPKEELASYYGIPYINSALKQLQRTQMPYTLIIGKPTIFISDKVRKQWSKFVPGNQLITLPDYGHLLPIEAPQECAKAILQNFNND